MSKGIIGIDCDLTLCAIDELWIKWLISMTGVDRTPSDYGYWNRVAYDISKYWEEDLDKLGIDGLDFFRGTNIYDFAEPMPSSKHAVKALKGLGYEIVVISALKGNHHKSKYNWVKRNFDIDGFVGTKEKQYIPCDIFIDDRNRFLNMSKATHKIKLDTPYTQCEPIKDDNTVVCKDWLSIYEYIKELK